MVLVNVVCSLPVLEFLSVKETDQSQIDIKKQVLYAISKITFSIGGFFGGYRSYVVELSDRLKAYTKLWEDEEPLSMLDGDNEEPFTKDTFIAALRDLHIGEWLRRYSTKRFGYTVCDGTQWELEFEYSNGHKPVRFDGDNSYPYNFDKLQMLFGIDETEEDEDEQI